MLDSNNLLDPQTDSASYTGPCPPSSDVIYKSPVLTEAVKEAQKQADLDRDADRTPGWIEHGGWILWKVGTRNKFKYLIKDPRHARNTPAVVVVYLEDGGKERSFSCAVIGISLGGSSAQNR